MTYLSSKHDGRVQGYTQVDQAVLHLAHPEGVGALILGAQLSDIAVTAGCDR